MSAPWEAESPNVVLIKEHFKELQLEAFDNDRVSRICRTCGCTLPELCAVAGIFKRGAIKAMWENNRWPAPVALHFIALERCANERIFQTAVQPSPQEIEAASLLARRQETGGPS